MSSARSNSRKIIDTDNAPIVVGTVNKTLFMQVFVTFDRHNHLCPSNRLCDRLKWNVCGCYIHVYCMSMYKCLNNILLGQPHENTLQIAYGSHEFFINFQFC